MIMRAARQHEPVVLAHQWAVDQVAAETLLGQRGGRVLVEAVSHPPGQGWEGPA